MVSDQTVLNCGYKVYLTDDVLFLERVPLIQFLLSKLKQTKTNELPVMPIVMTFVLFRTLSFAEDTKIKSERISCNTSQS